MDQWEMQQKMEQDRHEQVLEAIDRAAAGVMKQIAAAFGS